MVSIEGAMDGIGNAAKEIISKAEPLFFIGGFMCGVTEAESNAGKYSGMNLQTMVSARLADTLSHLGIAGVQTGNGQTSGQVAFKFNPFGFINRFAGLAALGSIYREAKLPYSTEVKDVLWPLGIGGAIGGLFDPPYGGSQQYVPQMQKQYTTSTSSYGGTQGIYATAMGGV